MPLASDVVKLYPEQIVTLALWREARGESYEVKLGIANVIRNRAADPRWPNQLDEVVLQPLQFSSFNKTDWNTTKFPERKQKADWKAYLECAKAVEESVEKSVVGGANHYHDTSIPTPGWAMSMKKICQIGKIIFYKG